MGERYTIGIDLGGTNARGCVMDERGQVVRRRTVPTRASEGLEAVLARLVGLAGDLLTAAGVVRDQVRAVGLGVPGPLSRSRGIVFSAPNLPGWVDVPLRERFSTALGLPCVLENDANAAAYGEFVAGAGRGVRDMVMLTLGTGIGGGIILDGQLWRGRFDNAGEIGHTIVQPDGEPCPCGQRGCLERYASASAIARLARQAIEAGEDSSLSGGFAARAGKADRRATDAAPGAGSPDSAPDRAFPSAAITAVEVERAAAAGDALAGRIWDQTCRWLAIACVNLQHILNPELIVLAGGLSGAGEHLLAGVRAHFERLSWRIAPDAPRIELAQLGPDAGAIGAAALAREGS